MGALSDVSTSPYFIHAYMPLFGEKDESKQRLRESIAQIIFGLTRLRETKSTYFWCKLAEGRIETFRVMRLGGTKQIVCES